MKIQNTTRNIFSIGLVLAITFLTLPAARAATNAEQANAPVVSNLRLPFNQTVFVTLGDSSEFVAFSGDIHFVVNYIPNDPVLPPSPIRIHTNMMNVAGIGQTSGLTYRLDGAANFEFPVNVPGSFSFGASYRLVPSGPPIREIPGSPPIRESSLDFSYHVALNSDGAVTAAEALAVIVEN